jgi:hypothetical protein
MMQQEKPEKCKVITQIIFISRTDVVPLFKILFKLYSFSLILHSFNDLYSMNNERNLFLTIRHEIQLDKKAELYVIQS